MSAWFLIATALLNLGVAAGLVFEGKPWWAVVQIFYGGANLAWIMALR